MTLDQGIDSDRLRVRNFCDSFVELVFLAQFVIGNFTFFDLLYQIRLKWDGKGTEERNDLLLFTRELFTVSKV